jgi:hypothetical protein
MEVKDLIDKKLKFNHEKVIITGVIGNVYLTSTGYRTSLGVIKKKRFSSKTHYKPVLEIVLPDDVSDRDIEELQKANSKKTLVGFKGALYNKKRPFAYLKNIEGIEFYLS